MRNISAASLAKIAQKTGSEPVLVVEVEWQIGQQPAVYGDKLAEGIEPRIVQVANLEDVVNVSGSGTSQSVTITMDDSDGALENIFNNVDIHKKRVWVYQWFTDISFVERFLLFSGVIMTPVVWKEGDRTLTFNVTSQFDDVEVGFSPEEGDFPDLPESLVGTVWPLIFGTAQKVPLVRVDDIPYGGGGKSGSAADSITKDGTGIRDPALDPHIKDNDNNAGYAAKLAQASFIGYLEASFTARKNGELDDLASIDEGKGQFSNLAKQFLSQGNAYLKQAQTLHKNNDTLKSVQQTQHSHEKASIGVTNGAAFPQGKSMTLNLGGAKHTGYFLGDNFVITDRVHPDNEIYDGVTTPDPASDDLTTPTFGRTKFFYADAGTPLMIGALPEGVLLADPSTHVNPVRYIVSCTIPAVVVALYAYRTVQDVRSLYPIPSNYYEVDVLDYGTLPVTQVYFPQPLSSRIGPDGNSEGWSDEVYATATSPVGPNTVDIIRWMIEYYTTHEIDEDSFGVTRDLVASYPMNFALLDRPQVIQAVEQIARQARCIVWLKNNKFYIKYLPKKVAPTDVIREADVIEQSLEVSYTETENIMTKIFASWKPDYISKANLVILRYNILYYGMHERRDNYYTYNMQQLVEKSATFWLIREANTFKMVTLKVPLTKLNIETLDTVTLDFVYPFVANGPIDCIVQGASLDTNEYTLQLTLWVPVRAGEMTEYLFCFPADLTVQYVYPTPDDIQQGRAGSPTNPGVTFPTPSASNPKKTAPFTGDPGNGGTFHPTKHHKQTWGADPLYTPDNTPANTFAPDIITRIDTTGVTPLGNKPVGTTKYQLDRAKVKSGTVTGVNTNVIAAKILSKDGDTYTVNAFFDGLDGQPTATKNCRVISVATDSEFAKDTPCFLLQYTWKDGKGNAQIQNIIQPTVWG